MSMFQGVPTKDSFISDGLSRLLLTYAHLFLFLTRALFVTWQSFIFYISRVNPWVKVTNVDASDLDVIK